MRVARDFDLNGVHKHQKNGKTIYMPGKSHKKLNKALRARNLPPTPIPGEGGMNNGGMAKDMGMMGMAMEGGQMDGREAQSMDKDFAPLGDMMNPESTDRDVDNAFTENTDTDIDNVFDLGLKGDKDDDGNMELY